MPSPEIVTDSLAIALFGPMQVRVQGILLPTFRSRKPLWLLALLTLRHERPVEREWLAGTLWPDLDQSKAFTNLRPVLSELRKALASQGQRLQSPDRHTLVLELQGADVDVLQFDAAIKSGTPSDLERAATLYSGLLLEGCSEEWVFQERTLREQNCLQALQKLGDAALTGGDNDAAVGYYRRAVSLDPWQEAARRGWMEALAKKGDVNSALHVYREFVAFLKDDPHATPDEQTSALYQRLRAEVRQRVSSHAVVVANETAVPTVSGYLPHPLTDLVGREDERLEAAARLGRSRLVTLTGLGGIGKTRLALAVAAEVVRQYPDGVWLVALESLSEGRLAAPQIASVLGLREEPGRPLLESLTDYLRNKRLLLVLDNCEHLLEASAQVADHLLRECAEVRILATSREALGIAGETVWAIPALTTPDPAHLPQPQVTLLRVLMGYESIELFVERAQAVQKTFLLTKSNARMVAEVCFRLEGIPLAIELAAARIKAMTVEQIAARLNNELGLLTGGSRTALSRQQTLRATLEWSYDLLTEPERVLLRRLSVFAGGWTLEAAEAVCIGSEIEAREISNLLTALVDKSLVVFEGQEGKGRYRLLEMVRQYGAEKLEATGETGWVKTRRRDYFSALVEEAEAELMGASQGAWLERLEVERANLRAALDGCRVDGDGAKAGLRLAGALYRFWEMHGHYSEGRAYLSEALAQDRAGERTSERATALTGSGRLAYYQGDHTVARSLLEEGLSIFRELGDRQGAAWSLNDLGDVAVAQGDGDAARSLYEESLALFRELGDRQGMASLLHHLGRTLREQGDYEQAQALYEESLALFRKMDNRQGAGWTLYHLGSVAGAQRNHTVARSLLEEGLSVFRELGNRQGVAWSLNDLGDVVVAQGDGDAAQALYEESLALFRELGNRQGMASLLHHLGRAVWEQGDYAQAQTLYEESLALFRELGNRQGEGWVLNGMGGVALGQGRCNLARTLYAEGIGILEEVGDKRGTVESLEGLAAVRLTQSEIEAAVRLFGAAHRLRENLGFLASPNRQAKLGSLMARVRAALGENAFGVAWEEGRAMTWEQAAAFAVGGVGGIGTYPTRHNPMSL